MSSTRSPATTELERHIRMPVSVPELAQSYKAAHPFPYLVIDDLFSPEMLDRLLAEMPEPGRGRWIEHDRPGLERKLGQRSVLDLEGTGRELLSFLHSAPFLHLLSSLTGIKHLLPDPYMTGGGFSDIGPGGFFNVHVDRNIAYETGLTRRMAMIIYLNKRWRPEYGGQLELWDREGSRCEAVVEPEFNRTVIFEVGPANYHAVRPVAEASGRSRLSFLTYFHTVGPEGWADATAHTTVFPDRLKALVKPTLQEHLRDWLPPVLVRALRRARHA